MDILKCKAFVTAANEGSFTAAGKIMGYTPSGISQLVAAMEKEFGFSLLMRKSNGVVLTREGEYIYPLAIEFIEKETELYKAATELSGMYKGNVMIAAYSSIAAQVLPQIIKDFTDLHPSINIQIEEATKNKIDKIASADKINKETNMKQKNQILWYAALANLHDDGCCVWNAWRLYYLVGIQNHRCCMPP